MVPPRPTRFAWYLLSRTITRCTSASGTLLARAWLATMLSYCARLCAIASGETSSAAAAANTNFGKLFIKIISARCAVTIGPFGSSITGRRCGEKSTTSRRDFRKDAHSLTDRIERDVQIVCAMRRVCYAKLRHADAHDCRANEAMKVY